MTLKQTLGNTSVSEKFDEIVNKSKLGVKGNIKMDTNAIINGILCYE